MTGAVVSTSDKFCFIESVIKLPPFPFLLDGF
jgi:hypothetical protein